MAPYEIKSLRLSLRFAAVSLIFNMLRISTNRFEKVGKEASHPKAPRKSKYVLGKRSIYTFPSTSFLQLTLIKEYFLVFLDFFYSAIHLFEFVFIHQQNLID